MSSQQVPTVSSTVNDGGGGGGTTRATKPTKTEIPFRRNQRKQRLYLIAIIVLVLACLFLIAAIVAIILTFLVNKPIKPASNETVIEPDTHDNCTYGYVAPYCDECGVTYAEPNVKIVGGVSATRNSWPAQAIITFSYKADVKLPDTQENYLLDQTYLCGGTLINRRTILTAAHCFPKTIEFERNGVSYIVDVTPNSYFPTPESMVRVYLGAHTLGAGSTAIAFNVSLVKAHEDFNEANNLNDIAVLRLAKEATLSQSIQIACLPDPEKIGYPTTYNQDVWAMGFGTLSSQGSSPSTLQNVKMTLYDGRTQCTQVAPTVTKNWNSQLCAGELKGGKDTCQGDSGGSIYVKDQVNNSTKFIAVGVVSYGVGCALPNRPGIYTRISYYLDWINKYV